MCNDRFGSLWPDFERGTFSFLPFSPLTVAAKHLSLTLRGQHCPTQHSTNLRTAILVHLSSASGQRRFPQKNPSEYSSNSFKSVLLNHQFFRARREEFVGKMAQLFGLILESAPWDPASDQLGAMFPEGQATPRAARGSAPGCKSRRSW